MDNIKEVHALVEQVIKIKPSMQKNEVLALSLNKIISILDDNESQKRREKLKEEGREKLSGAFKRLSTMHELDKYPDLPNDLIAFIGKQGYTK